MLGRYGTARPGRRADAHVVVLDVGMENAVGGGGPLVEMRLDPVGVVLQEAAELGRLVGARDIGRADQARR